MYDDAQLLRQYVATGSEPAFRELVERHIPLVNSTARRMVAGDTHLAQDVTQLVFTDLARKAAALPPGVLLGGWLHRHTCFTAAKAVRTECRRRARERTAMEINAVNDPTAADAHWAQLAPVLDDALNRLDAPDRDALVLRFLQQRDLRSVGRALGTSDDTAQKRVSRALEKLRGLLSRRGVAVTSTTLLATTLDAATVTTVPSGLATTVSAHALSTAAATTGLTLLSLKTMITSKLALGLAATFVVAGTTAIVITHTGHHAALATVAQTSAPATPARTPQIFTANKIEAPKLPPAPAGDKPATPDDLAASAAANAPVIMAGGFGQTGAGTVTTSTARVMSFSAAANAVPVGQHSASVSGDGVNVTYTIDGVSHTVPAGTAFAVTDPQTGGMVSVGPGTISMPGGSGGVGGIVNGSNGSVSRRMSIVNGQMTSTTTINGVATMMSGAVPPPVPGAALATVVSGSSSGDSQTMTIVDQNGVAHTVQLNPVPAGEGSGVVIINTNPDGTTNTLQTTPTSASP